MATAPLTKINRQDLKIYPSERLTDNDDGGGMPVGSPPTGEPNELFEPISSIARVNGGFYARLEYAGVQRPDDESLIGSAMAITKPPKDPNTDYLLFRATKFGETRAEILKRIEAYNVKTIESRMTLLSVQAANSKVIQAYQTVGEPLPNVGDVYCLDQNKAGYPIAEQYIQVTRVSSEDRDFVDGQGKKFKKTVVKLGISTKLETDFIGLEYPVEGYASTVCKIRETGVADAAEFYGVKPLAAAIAKESSKIKLPNLMSQLVPTNQITTSLKDLTAAGQTQTLFDGSRTGTDGIVTLAVSKNHSAGQTTSLYFGNAITPNSVIIGSSVGDITDKGGVLYQLDKAIGTVDYAAGSAIINEPTFGAYINNIKFRPSMTELKVADTQKIDVTINNRSDSYTFNIFPPPAVGTLQASYRSQGRWIDLKDDGSGALRGISAGHGSGSVSLVTGSGSITTGELPDVGSAILLSWGTRANYFNRSGGAAVAKMLLQLSDDADPSSLVLAWHTDSDKVATCDASGNITGDWTGQYDLATRQIRINTGANFKHPNGVLDITATYNKGQKISKELPAPYSRNGVVSLQLADLPIKPNSVKLEIPIDGGKYTTTAHDDGQGHLLNNSNAQIGTIDYQTATATFDTTVSYQYQYEVNTPKYEYMSGIQTFVGYSKETVTKTTTMTLSGNVKAWFFDTSPTSQVVEHLTSGTIEIDVLPYNAEVIAPSSINVKWGAKTYFDKLGTLFCDLNPVIGEATTAGTVSYQNGILLLKNWQWTDGSNPVITSLVTSVSGNIVDHAVFRTPKSPIKAGGISIRATAVDGTLITAKAGIDGVIKAANVLGTADFEYGVASVKFGKWVTDDATAQAQKWYSKDNVSNGQVWQPIGVFAESITYNADANTYLPIDTSVVKIDTVRLPQDGRVPIFRPGYSIVIGNRLEQELGSAFTGGQTIQLSRGDLDRICLNDADGKPVDANLWDYDLEQGSITFKTTLDLSPYKMPLKAMHAQEEMRRILETDIDGTLTLTKPTGRAYPIENTYVSSLLIGGNLQVRVSVPFTQKAWRGVWIDVPDGEQLLNKLNLTDHPMKLTDDGAITAKWMIRWGSSLQFELYSDVLGFVGKFDTLTDLAPINPWTQKPYFVIAKEAFGNKSPWEMQTVIRFNTWGTLLPTWVLCSVQPSDPIDGEDGFIQCLYGDTTELVA